MFVTTLALIVALPLETFCIYMAARKGKTA